MMYKDPDSETLKRDALWNLIYKETEQDVNEIEQGGNLIFWKFKQVLPVLGSFVKAHRYNVYIRFQPVLFKMKGKLVGCRWF